MYPALPQEERDRSEVDALVVASATFRDADTDRREHLAGVLIERSAETTERILLQALPALDDGPQYETSELLVFQR